MKPLKIMLVLVAAGALAVAAWLNYGFSEVERPLSANDGGAHGEVPSDTSASGLPTVRTATREPHSTNHLNAFAALSRQYSGKELSTQQALAFKQAVAALDGVELQEYLEKVSDDIDPQVLKSGIQLYVAFDKIAASSGDTGRMESWLISLKNPLLQSELFGRAGGWFSNYESDNDPASDRFKAFLADIPSTAGKDTLLQSYCMQKVSVAPELGIRSFLELNRKGADFSQLSALMQRLPAKTDFAAISNLLPGDDKSVARNAREAMLGTWAATDPQAAASFVMTTSSVYPSQMEAVITRWQETSPSQANTWIASMEASPRKDYAYKSVAIFNASRDPKMAWDTCYQIENGDVQYEAFQKVYQAWKKRAPQAADAAWKEIAAAQQP